MHYMPTPLSLRVSQDSLDRLKRLAKAAGLPPRTLAQRYLEEGLRMDEHPLIHFVDGPAGRRASMRGWPGDVWEIISLVRDNDGDEVAAADYLEVPVGVIQAAIAYYGAYTEEIDARIESNQRAREEGYAVWKAGQAALRR